MKTIEHITIAMDSFKGSMTAFEACNGLYRGLTKGCSGLTIDTLPIADGGEGSLDIIRYHRGGTRVCCKVHDPLNRMIESEYLILDDGTAIIEMAKSSGLTLLKPSERNPMVTTSYGFGELIKHALNHHCDPIMLCIGGSATNDGGSGMASALGVRFLDRDGHPIKCCGGNLSLIERIDISGIDPRIKTTKFIVLSDVTNPLCGPQGASFIYGPQKGASKSMVKSLDDFVDHYAKCINQEIGIDIHDIHGSGAAGGMGGGLIAFCGATIKSGIDTLMDMIGFDDVIRQSDLLICGEGQIDGSSIYNKVCVGVAKRAKSIKDIPVLAICGNIGKDAQSVYDHGIDSIFSIAPGPITVAESMQNGGVLLEDCGYRLGRLITTMK